MKSDKLMDAITNIDDDLLDEARKEPAEAEEDKKTAGQLLRLSSSRLRRACAGLALVLILGGLIWMIGKRIKGREAIPGTEHAAAGTETEGSLPADPGAVISAGPIQSPTETPAETQPPASKDPADPAVKPVVLAEAEFPEDWRWNEASHPGEIRPVLARRTAGKTSVDLYRSFFADVMLQLLSDNGQDNSVMSPVNIFLATAMLAEISGGATQQEILGTLGVGDLSELREQAARIWGLCYLDDGAEKLVLGNSVWLSDSLSYRKEAVRRLADSYYASVFQGKMGSDEYSELFRTWLNEMTAYFLKEQLQSAGLNHGTLFALASTIYLKTQWVTAFSEKLTKNAVFSGARGEETVPFMNQQAAARGCFIGENYRMARLETKQGLIWFFLPDEDSTVAAMMEAASFRNWLAHTDLSLVPGIETRQGSVNISVPKLDIDASQDLIDSLAALGIRRCFETDQADLSPFLDFPGVCVGSAKQCSRLLLDEKGVIAASAVVMTGAAWAPQDRTIDFVVDRPFFLLITGPEAVPLFAAVINTIQP